MAAVRLNANHQLGEKKQDLNFMQIHDKHSKIQKNNCNRKTTKGFTSYIILAIFFKPISIFASLRGQLQVTTARKMIARLLYTDLYQK